MRTDLVIGFTGSPAGRDAVALGRRLALATGARPTVVHVRPPKPVDVNAPDGWSWGASVAATLDEARPLLADVPGARFRVAADTSVARVLHRVAAEAESPLIVLGATHRSGLGRVIPGTTADAVIHGAPCAVAIAPAGYARRPDACPFGPPYAGAMGYAMIGDLVCESSSAMLERAAAAATGSAPVLVERCVAEGDVDDEIARHSDDADLLVIGARGYGPLRRALLRGAAGRIVRAATCPVLVVPRGVPAAMDDPVVPLAAAVGALAATDLEAIDG